MGRQGSGGASRQIRIIGGEWRGRRVSFEAAEGLRPTGDRVRETLFNWLAPRIHGARCLDLFAGSGVLGMEALSRGAASCDFVDTHRRSLSQIARHLEEFGGQSRASLHNTDAFEFTSQHAFDIIFVDPPFALDGVAGALAHLSQSQLLAPSAWLYVEAAVVPGHELAYPGFASLRQKRAGDVDYGLLEAAGGP